MDSQINGLLNCHPHGTERQARSDVRLGAEKFVLRAYGFAVCKSGITLNFMLRVVIIRNVALALCLFLGSSLANAAPKPNLILITLDSTRADRMGFLGAKMGHTPNLDRLAGESLVFEHAYAQAPRNCSVAREYSFWSLSAEHWHERDWWIAASGVALFT